MSAGEPVDTTDEDLKLADGPPIGKLAAAFTAMSGLFVALSGLQILGIRFYTEVLELVPYMQIALGVAQIGVGAMVYRARGWAVLVGTVGGGVIALGSLGWLFYFVLGVGLSCMVVITPLFSVLAAILCAVSVPAVRRTAAARQRLSDRGLGLGL